MSLDHHIFHDIYMWYWYGYISFTDYVQYGVVYEVQVEE